MEFSKMLGFPMKVRIKRPKVGEWAKNVLWKFLRKYFDLPESTYVDTVLKSWKKAFVQFFFDIVFNGAILSVALILVYYFYLPDWRVALLFWIPLGVASWVFRRGVEFLRGKPQGSWLK